MSDELPGFRFIVTLDPADAYLPPAQARLLPELAPGAFQEAKGLSADLEVMAYPEGGLNGYVHQLPVRHTWGRLTLSRGIARDPLLWQWYESGLSRSLGARRDGSVMLLDYDGRQVMGWDFHAGIAVKWGGPEFNASQNSVAMESLEIAHHGLSLAGGTFDLGAAIDTVAGLFD